MCFLACSLAFLHPKPGYFLVWLRLRRAHIKRHRHLKHSRLKMAVPAYHSGAWIYQHY
jgi:hypothetical protein